MSLIAFGINHTTASVDIREKLAFTPAEIEPALRDAADKGFVREIAILSTCNRTEIYCQSEQRVEQLLEWLSTVKGLNVEDLVGVHYAFADGEAARHMMRVASGLDSLVLGEPQILGQMKSSFATAKESGSLGRILHDAFQRVFSVAKKVRSETAIGENPVSVAYAAVSLAQQIFSDLKQDTALLIGAGETIELVARHLREQGIKKIIVANRTLENARRLAEMLNAEAIMLAEIPDYLHQADIVVSSTASQLPLLGKGAVEVALKKRKHKPMFMMDIAVPRDIEAQVGELDDVFLYTVDDLKEVINENKRSREQAAEIAYDIIDNEVERYLDDVRSLSAVDTIKSFRQSIDELREQELQKSLKQLSNGVPAEEILGQLARNLSNKFMHGPTAQVKKASAEGREDIVKTLHTLFDLPEPGIDDAQALTDDIEEPTKKHK
ncbi:Glutamyl-tRNA reductase [Thalassocella blandensis]|nr:Glutamyl-tRNA reductase [Thalassocella blandensis]